MLTMVCYRACRFEETQGRQTLHPSSAVDWIVQAGETAVCYRAETEVKME